MTCALLASTVDWCDFKRCPKDGEPAGTFDARRKQVLLVDRRERERALHTVVNHPGNLSRGNSEGVPNEKTT